VHATGFRSVFALEVPGDPQALARRVAAELGSRFGNITAVIQPVASREDTIRAAAIRIGQDQLAAGQTFCFRLHKRGLHWISTPTRMMEAEIGAALADAVEVATGRKPVVSLDAPDVTIVAEMLGPVTWVGLQQRIWRAEPKGTALTRPPVSAVAPMSLMSH
jgi:tRNA(Ser,Leu) C12 N-acetylase TAN1